MLTFSKLEGDSLRNLIKNELYHVVTFQYFENRLEIFLNV